ncbi:MAG: hypothetical protein CSA13_02390 [Clostridiales bacterium]|nr:MAG: hypothetical protein CSA13_02390 [Clostridiales bacterium]
MKLLVDEILNISKLDSKEYVLKREKVDIRDIVEQSLDNFRQLAIQKSIKIVTEIDEVHTEINVDALQIYKAINTIIDNAFKYAVSTVMIKTYLKRNALYVDIYNDGKPIDKQRAAHIFDRFYSTNDYNSGIGLAMAKEILRLSKGDVLIENAKDGVVFKVKIPWK